ncbi:MAG TPA: transcription elongation factor GreA [Polyangiaceae bacterium LLY-WYZ-15_(1-7)]|nr:transcription elongation factor GreA [Myxococcales bacterium]MAT29423.1 transcription elongation factor GreA [Sandaracinus sp.]HJK95099.1 transcription elongation factor GreA [Polyangiaceae bacterium LLY-WYZ-15_(1-7)]MBJ70777.1 transcription elongation factor GreA [Sandaracinus sp.]HJL01927.1 transcription elongation factor GreA [Polyangiaceae bacterium LLY-WYZ-15_(1-7)]
MDRVPMTPQGFETLKKELDRLKAEMPKISQEIGVAREHGDLKENAEYHAAKEKQGMVAARIAELEDKIARAEVIDPSQLGGEKVKFGAIVELEDIDSGKIVTYQIVGSEEADISKGSISVTSPVAKALIGREVGDEVKVRTPGGTRMYEVADVRWE